jgi:hypothetical protein
MWRVDADCRVYAPEVDFYLPVLLPIRFRFVSKSYRCEKFRDEHFTSRC